MIETATSEHQRQAFAEAHAARGATLRLGVRWIVKKFQMPLRFDPVRTLTAMSR